MARDNDIQIVAGLDIPKSKSTIDKDVPILEKELQNDKSSRPKLIATLDITKSKKAIQANLDTLISKTDAPKIKVGIDVGGVNETRSITTGLKDIQTQAKQTASNLLKLEDRFKNPISPILNSEGLIDAEKTISKIQSRFQELGNVSVKGIDSDREAVDNLDKMIVSIKNGQNEARTLTFELDKMGKAFYLTGGTSDNSGIAKNLKNINKTYSEYTQKFAQFKSTNHELLSGLTQPLTEFETKLNGLKTGISTIEEVKSAYQSLQTASSNITQNFSRQLSPIDSAIRNISKGEETISGLKAEFKGLTNAPKEVNAELTKCASLLQNVKQIESEQGRTDVWSKAYREWIDLVDQLQAKLKTLRKEQVNLASSEIFKTSDLKKADIPYMTKVSSTIERQMAEIQKMSNTKGWQSFEVKGVEEANGKIKALTLTVRDAEGALKQFTMQRAKLDTGKSTRNGLMQVGDVKILETSVKTEEKLINAMANVREKSEQIRKSEEKRQQLAQNKAINKAIDEEYKQRVKAEEISRKQLETNRKLLLSFKEMASKKISSAKKKYSYADMHDANAMSTVLNGDISSFGDLSKSEQTIKALSISVDKIIADLEYSHKLTLNSLNDAINKEEKLQSQEKKLQSQKDSFNQKNLNAIDFEIQKREEQSRKFSQALKEQMTLQSQSSISYQKDIDKAIKHLNTLNNNSTFRNNSANVDVQTQKQNIQNLIAEYETLKIQLQGNMSFEGLQQLGDKLVVLKSQFDTVQAETDELKAKLNLSRDLNRMSKDIDILRNRIAIFRSENTKSEKMMGGTFNSLDTRLRDLKKLTDSGILDKQTFANISRDFRNAEKEVKKFGWSGKTVFQTLGEQAKKFSSWMSLTYIIASFARSVRRAVSELKEINTVLTEISKTSDRTSESLERLGKASFDRASQYGRKASDYLTGVQEMSRAGFGEQESENMAELSVLAQSAGDMTAELANQYLIATNAGYKLEGNAKKLNSILDSQNYITNRNALNLSELAEATKIVSSQASQAGIGIDEMTAAVGTMIATTQQGGEVASRSFKGRRTIRTIALYGCKSIAA